MNVMIVDSTSEARAAIRRSIDTLPCEVRELDSAEDAIQQCAVFRPDVLIISLHLAGMHGFSAMRVLRAICPDARIIVVTELDGAPVRRRARELGASLVISTDELPALATHLRRYAGGSAVPPRGIGTEVGSEQRTATRGTGASAARLALARSAFARWRFTGAGH
jgi:DNA-binding NarL/FixJ family response regulator